MPAKAYRGIGMEGRIAKWYAANTVKEMGEFQALAARVTAGLPPGARVLDLAPGPGYLAVEIAKAGDYHVSGLDISQTFIDIARRAAEEHGVRIDWRLGDAAHMPFADESMNFVICRAAFKNFADPVGALKEMRRVLRPGGTSLVIDLRKDASREAIHAEVAKMGLSKINAAFTRAVFRFTLLRRAYTKAQFQQFATEAGFVRPELRDTTIGFEAWMTK